MTVGGEMFCPLNLEKTLSDRNSLVITLPPTIAAPKMMFISEVRTKNVARIITIVVKNDEKNFCLSMSYAPLFLGVRYFFIRILSKNRFKEHKGKLLSLVVIDQAGPGVSVISSKFQKWHEMCRRKYENGTKCATFESKWVGG